MDGALIHPVFVNRSLLRLRDLYLYQFTTPDISRQLQNAPPATFLRPSCYQRFCLKCGWSICTEFYCRCEAVVIDIKVVQIYVRSEDSETLFGQHVITSLIVHGILVQQLS